MHYGSTSITGINHTGHMRHSLNQLNACMENGKKSNLPAQIDTTDRSQLPHRSSDNCSSYGNSTPCWKTQPLRRWESSSYVNYYYSCIFSCYERTDRQTDRQTSRTNFMFMWGSLKYVIYIHTYSAIYNIPTFVMDLH